MNAYVATGVGQKWVEDTLRGQFVAGRGRGGKKWARRGWKWSKKLARNEVPSNLLVSSALLLVSLFKSHVQRSGSSRGRTYAIPNNFKLEHQN